MGIVAVPRRLREKLGEDATDDLVILLNESDKDTKEDVIDVASERFERRLTEEITRIDRRITEEVAKLNERISDEVAKLDKRITEESAKLDKRITEEAAKLDKRITEEAAKLDKRISETKTEIIKWMFIFWVGQVGMILGILFAFFK
ncbi:MAG: LA_3696 family protein [Nitrospirota bacterium]